jgi:hypothetical protein
VKRARIIGGVSVLLLLLTAVALLALLRQAPTPSQRARDAKVGPPPKPADRLDVPALPPHVLNIAFGPMDLTADAAAEAGGPPLIVVSGDELEIIVRPERELREKAAVKVFWRKTQSVRRWRPPAEYGQHSTHRFRGRSERPFGRGPGEIVAVVSPVPDIPDEVPAAWLDFPPRHWLILKQRLRWK